MAGVFGAESARNPPPVGVGRATGPVRRVARGIAAGRLGRYGFATLCVAVAIAARLMLTPVVGDRQPFATLFVALTAAAGYGGRGPVLYALGLGYLGACAFLVEPPFSHGAGDPAMAGVYFVVGLSIAAFSDVMHAARDRERRSAEQALRKQGELEEQIARRERAERDRGALLDALRNERQRLEAVLQQMPAGVVIAGAPSGRLVLANAQVQSIWGRPIASADDFDAAVEAPGRWPLARSLARGEVVRDEEIPFRRADGSLGTLCVSSSPIRDPSGAIIAAAVVFYDITDRKADEAALRLAREDLELRVAERTADLEAANEALRREASERRQAEGARNDLLRRLVDVQEAERARIARELHDQMGQQLTALKLGLDALADGPGDEAARREKIARLLDLARQIGHDMHRIAWELGPAALDGYDLPTALASYAQEWSDHAGVPVQVQAPIGRAERLPRRLETTVYRIVQEALTNVARHARAGRVSLIVDRRDDSLGAIVEDDGIGFDATEAPSPRGGLGLIGMRERAEAVGGSLQVESGPGGGTTVFVRVPLREALPGEPSS